MKDLFRRFRSLESYEQTYWIGLLMLFIGLTWYVSVFMALIVIGASMTIESVITSYLAALFASRSH
jgi:hypothetical protein